MKTTSIALLTLFSFAFANPTTSPATCPTCDYRPTLNKCHITTSCILDWGHNGAPKPYYCACRAGYRATNVKPEDTSKQWRLPWVGNAKGDPSQEGRVFVAPGVVCDTLCDQWQLGKDGCKEVKQVDSCL
ncbi:hypothetical protein yc1106_09106 [Curvularia clavata]|uniref:Uncharacterized protein n=1 Tax=Curvularia clavata TaxID=95742 RepID=A0A9Q9DWF6_CURCL|nr:hypothetical protein yc1106_09106 [Curvularia clavata]